MDENAYNELLGLVTPLIQRNDTVMRESISPHERLTATLRFLATGRSYQDLRFSTAISQQALSKIIPDTCRAIYKVLRNKYMKKSMGKPNIYLNEDGHLVLLVNIYKGDSNRVIDSGLNSVGIQLKDIDRDDLDSNLIHYLSTVLKVNEGFFSIAQGDNSFKRVVTIHEDSLQPYDVVDKLIAALEITAKEDPSALRKVDLGDIEPRQPEENNPSEGDSTKEFDWRD